jgi:predicted neuraminidase
MNRRVLSIAVLILFAQCALADGPLFESELVFDPEQAIEPHGHVHASCIVECPNGDLRAVWYENGRELPAPFFDEQKDKSADVRIGGSRRQPGAKEWEEPFVMSDTFGVSDNNPCMVIDKQGRLWLFHATLLGVPDWSWGSCVLRYMVASRYDHPGRPTWDKSNVLVPQVTGFDEVLQTALDARKADGWPDEKINQARQYVKLATGRPLATRVGWMPRAHPIVRNDGALLVPLANENSLAACMAITNDNGETWTFSKLVPDLGLEQPSVVQYPDGTMTAFFRNDSGRIKRSDSTDGGMTWGTVTRTDRPHPNSGIEAVLLANGKLLLAYNDKEDERDSLAVSLSDDRGKSWRWTRHIENAKGGRYDYPSVVQSKDGSIHATYSLNAKAIKHARFDEAWIVEGDR